MITRFRTLVCILGVAILVAACGAKKPATVTTLPHEPVRMAIFMPKLPMQSVNCPVAQELTAGKTTLIWLVPAEQTKNLQEMVIPAFESQNPAIHVEIKRIDTAKYFEESQSILAAGCQAPDLLNISDPMSAYYAAYGWLKSLWNEYTFDEKEDWIQALRKSGRYNQELYSAPYSTTTSLLFYNKSLFTKAGITPPGEDERWTWEKIAESAKKLAQDENGDGLPETWGVAWQDSSIAQLLPLVQSLGGQPTGEDGEIIKGVIDSQAWLDALTFYRNLFTTWKGSPSSEDFDADQAFREGKLAMLIAPYSEIGTLSGINFEWGVSRYPYFEKGKVVTPTGAWQVGINANSVHPEEAVALITWLTTRPGGEVLLKAGTFVPQKTALNLSISENWATVPVSAHWKTVVNETLMPTLPGPITPYYPVYEKFIVEAFREIRSGADPKTTLTETAVQLQAEMK